MNTFQNTCSLQLKRNILLQVVSPSVHLGLQPVEYRTRRGDGNN